MSAGAAPQAPRLGFVVPPVALVAIVAVAALVRDRSAGHPGVSGLLYPVRYKLT